MRLSQQIGLLLTAVLLAAHSVPARAGERTALVLKELAPLIEGPPFESRAVMDAEAIFCPGAAYRLRAPGWFLLGATQYPAGKDGASYTLVGATKTMVRLRGLITRVLSSFTPTVDFRVMGEKGAGYLLDVESDSCTHLFAGKCEPPYRGYLFDGDPGYPLTFKKVKASGYVYVCGRGAVTTPDGRVHRLGYEDGVGSWLPLLASGQPLEREGAAQALGWLPKTQTETDLALPALTAALEDDAMEVRRNAAEALGRIGDPRGLDPLTARLTAEKDDWVRDVAEESLGLIRVKTAAQELPEAAALAALTEGLKHKWPLVRRTAADLLAKGGTAAVAPLIASLKDADGSTRATAATALGVIGDGRALEPVKQALAEEKDEAAKKAMQEALQRLGK